MSILTAEYDFDTAIAVKSDLAQTICTKITTLKNDSVTRRCYVMTALKIADLQRDAYTEGREEGISLGREEGISIGVYQKALETARAMISIGLPEGQIQLCTALPLEVIRDLLKKEL